MAKQMTSGELRNGIVRALEEMKNKAVSMGISGVATASILNKGGTTDWIGEMSRWRTIQQKGRLESGGHCVVKMRRSDRLGSGQRKPGAKEDDG